MMAKAAGYNNLSEIEDKIFGNDNGLKVEK